jgi:hypothetical protein
MRPEITEFSLLKLSILLLESDVQLLDSTELRLSCARRKCPPDIGWNCQYKVVSTMKTYGGVQVYLDIR